MKSQEFKQTEIGKIPKGWEEVRLGDVTSYSKGKKPNEEISEKQENYFPYLTAEYLRKGIALAPQMLRPSTFPPNVTIDIFPL